MFGGGTSLTTNVTNSSFSGNGGAFGCADPDAGVSMGYVCNHMGPQVVGDPRTVGLCKAVLESAARLN